MKKYLFLLTIASFLLFINCSNDLSQKKDPEVRNIIFLIGDGMGVAQVYAAMSSSEYTLNMERTKHIGFAETFSLNKKITDSAAAGTALATGKKTKNGVIGQDSLGNEFSSILVVAERHGLATGLISTSAITHATPASFIAHELSRNDYEAIAADFLSTDIDVFIGGGYNHFAHRADSLNYIDSLINHGYQIVTTIEDVESTDSNKLAGLLYDEHPPRYSEGRGDMLPKATKKTLEILSKNEKGFFLMIEGSQIDWAGHANNTKYSVEETLDFDRTIGVVLEFLNENPNTLLVVTADHETGGMALTSKSGDYLTSDATFATGGHTSIMVPVFAYGSGAELFTGIFDNTGFFTRFIKLYGFDAE
ncbi:MAG: alkaline phosphatase [Bacteroidales bacterium]|nr:alkaline phosphatase [Bacteroidales bacterium]MCF8390797.1 alkaline phosphatase [Bacteroidales bacterium]